MKNAQYISVLLALAVYVSAQSTRGSDVPPPQKRHVSIEQAEKLSNLNAPFDSRIPDTVVNPFDPGRVASATVVSRPTSDRDLLVALAEQVNPSGTAILGGQPYLLFSQKRIKVGEKISISFENAAYEVEVISIERTTFTIRYNQEEFTRPVTISNTPKSGTNP